MKPTFRRIDGVDGWPAFEVYLHVHFVGYVARRGNEWGFVRAGDAELVEGAIRTVKRAVQWGFPTQDAAAANLLPLRGS